MTDTGVGGRPEKDRGSLRDRVRITGDVKGHTKREKDWRMGNICIEKDRLCHIGGKRKLSNWD